MDSLKNTVLFRKLSKAHWEFLEPLLDMRLIATNTSITTAGSLGDSLYYITKGTVLLLHAGASGERPLLILKEGEYFGEFSVLQPGTRLLSAKSAENCTLVRVSSDSLETLRQRSPEAHWAFVSNLLRLIHLKARFLVPGQIAEIAALAESGAIGPSFQ